MEENKTTRVSPTPMIGTDFKECRIIRNDIPKKINDEDFDPINANIEGVKEVRKKRKKQYEYKRISTSTKPLKFDPNPDDSILKELIIKMINSRNLTYSDLYRYCTNIRGGDIGEGQKLGYNIISGLRHRRSMLDTTFSLLCDFLELDVMLVERKEEDDVSPDPDVDDIPTWGDE